MMQDGLSKPRVAILGAGISSLTTARKLVDAGYGVDIFEATGRAGGKIESVLLYEGGPVINKNAEFVDSTQKGVRSLSDELGVDLVAATDQKNILFKTPKGKLLSNDEFFAAARPLQEKIIRDKEIIARDPTGARARHLNSISSLTDYLHELNGQPSATPARTMGERVKNLWKRATGWLTHGRVSSAIVATYAGAYASEAGRDASSISALQFVRESSATPGELLASDCAYRVKGGTEEIIHALKKDLEAKGVNFHFNARATAVDKSSQDGSFSVAFADGTRSDNFDQMVLGLPLPALGKLAGLESLGFTAQEIRLMQEAQYTHSTKFSIRTRTDTGNATLFSSDGFQAWNSAPGVMTFLVGGETLNKMKGGALVDYCLNSYAAANGTTQSALFDKSHISYNGAGSGPACYASPARNQAIELTGLTQAANRLAKSGVGLVGTFLPCPEQGNSIGFMEDGVQSAARAASILIAQTRQRGAQMQEPALAPAPDLTSPGFIAREDRRRETQLVNTR